ncbi:MAG TPA: carboxypeptidase-like regulatory domain-containing protein, partial [Prolixibacteraceae bacterium]|nr:carboxypeptidase-like regulatory domain-containing protein [Prolixibacteraceae bacterium]
YLTLFLGILTPVFAQKTNPGLVKVTEAFKKQAEENQINKVFIKTDKDIYCQGEKIWFKAEIFNCLTEIPSNELELIVMLKGEKGEVIADNKYICVNGACNNALEIPYWAVEGNAYLVAYSPKALKASDASLAAVKSIYINSLRRNDYLFDLSLNKKIFRPGEEAKLSVLLTSLNSGIKREKIGIALYDNNQKIFSEKAMVTVDETNELKFKLPEKVNNGLYFEVSLLGKNNTSQKLPVYTTEDNIIVEFYPEGGTLLTNNLQRVLYRATDPFGEPIDVSGKVYDQLKNQAGIGKILKKGYGVINLMPMPNQKYYFKIEDEYGKNLEFKIPEAKIDGAYFSLLKTEDSTLRASVIATGKYASDTLTLAAISRGKVWMTSVLDGSKKNNLKIATSLFPRGILNFVIFSSNGDMISQRLVYNTPNQDINIGIETNFKPSETNGEAEITIDLNNFIDRFGKSKVDISIADKFNLNHPEEAEIQSFLKYPLQTPVPKTVLDIYLTNLELIADEYKYYNLKSFLNGKDEKLPNRIFSGTVTNKNRETIPKATVMALQSNNLALATTVTDQKGRFVLKGIPKTKDVIVKAFNSTGKKSYIVHLDRSFEETLEEILLFESFKPKSTFNKKEYIRYTEQNKELLKLIGSENKESKAPARNPNPEKLLIPGTSVLEVIRMTKPFKLDGNQIVFVGSQNSLLYQSGALIVIDGQKMGTDVSVLNDLSPYDVESINISTNPIDIQRYTGLNSVGIIEIKTKHDANNITLRTDKLGYHEKTVFDASKIPQPVWRYQTTLLWKNDIPVDDSGKVTFKLQTSEIRSDFIIQVDVVSEEGIRHHEITSFSTKRH